MYLRQQVEQLRARQAEAPSKGLNLPPSGVLTVLGLLVTITLLIVNATAFIAPLRSDVTRVEAQIVQLEEETLTKEIRLSQRIDGVETQLERNTSEVSTKLAQIQADILVIKSRFERPQ
jgi:hypothetical protein